MIFNKPSYNLKKDDKSKMPTATSVTRTDFQKSIPQGEVFVNETNRKSDFAGQNFSKRYTNTHVSDEQLTYSNYQQVFKSGGDEVERN